MSDYQRTVTVAVAPDAAFAALADTENLPRYVAAMVEARPRGDGHLHVAAEVEGRHEEGDARFEVDRDRRRLEWSGIDPSVYHGSLEAAADGAGTAVTLRIHSEHDHSEAEMTRVLDGTVASIRELLTSR